MDIKLQKRPWLVRHKYYVAGGVLFATLAVYTLVLQCSPARQRVSAGSLGIAEVAEADFLEYVEQEGVVQPMLALKVNSRVGGYVERIVVEEGARVEQGDTILLLSNPELIEEVEAQEDALHKQLMAYREQEIEMEQKTLQLRKQVLANRYEIERLADSYALSEEEFRMGIKSKAELDVERKEYEYKTEAGRLEQESLLHDSAATLVRRSLIKADREQEIRKFERTKAKRDWLVVRAPLAGQLSSLQVVPGQQVSVGSEIGEVKVLDRFKVRITPGEYYIDRIVAGLPARATYKGKTYGMTVKRVVPEVKEHFIGMTEHLSRKLHTNILAKDCVSLLAGEPGSCMNTSGSASLAKAGSGDVLTGVIAGCTAILKDIYLGAAAGAFLHGRAGTLAGLAKGPHSTLARDIAEEIGRAMEES